MIATLRASVARWGPPTATVVIVVVAVLAGAGLAFPSLLHPQAMTTYTAYFDETPGLYHDNSIDILGVPTGEVTSVRPTTNAVRVTFEVPATVSLPTDVHAVLMAPNPISDRTIELFPAYVTPASGPAPPRLAAGATIPLSRTAIPLGVDQVFSAVAKLSKALGPTGANSGGALSDVLRTLARLTDGNGAYLQKTLTALASALPAFTADPGKVSSLISSLDRLSSTLATNNATVDAFFGDVATATKQLAGERDELGSAIGNLQVALARTAAFIRTNRSALKGSLGNLATTSRALVADQQALMTTFRTAALGFDNVNRIIDPTTRCVPGETPAANGRCPVAFARADLPGNVDTVYQTYCRSAFQETLPIILGSVPGLGGLLKGLPLPSSSGVSASTLNTLCLVNAAALQGRPGSPGAPSGPDLGLSRFLP